MASSGAFHCPVCEEGFPSARLLPCRHQLCQACLSSWTAQAATCPVCRAHIPDPDLLPTVHHAKLQCYTCQARTAAYLMRYCRDCGEGICGNCFVSVVHHDPEHTTEPFARLGLVARTLAGLKRKADGEAGARTAKASRLAGLVGEALVERVGDRPSDVSRLAAALQRDFDLPQGLEDREAQAIATAPPPGAAVEARARQLLKMVGSSEAKEGSPEPPRSSPWPLDEGAAVRRAVDALLARRASVHTQTDTSRPTDQPTGIKQEADDTLLLFHDKEPNEEKKEETLNSVNRIRFIGAFVVPAGHRCSDKAPPIIYKVGYKELQHYLLARVSGKAGAAFYFRDEAVTVPHSWDGFARLRLLRGAGNKSDTVAIDLNHLSSL